MSQYEVCSCDLTHDYGVWGISSYFIRNGLNLRWVAFKDLLSCPK
jgi:hypothetical protein